MKQYKIVVTSEIEKKYLDNFQPYGKDEYEETVEAQSPKEAIQQAIINPPLDSDFPAGSEISEWFDVDSPDQAASAMVEIPINQFTTKRWYFDSCALDIENDTQILTRFAHLLLDYLSGDQNPPEWVLQSLQGIALKLDQPENKSPMSQEEFIELTLGLPTKLIGYVTGRAATSIKNYTNGRAAIPLDVAYSINRLRREIEELHNLHEVQKDEKEKSPADNPAINSAKAATENPQVLPNWVNSAKQ